MSSVRTLDIRVRDNAGTGNSRAARREGFVPAVVYGDNKDPMSVSLEERLLKKELLDPAIYSHLYTIKVSGKDERVLIREIQFHPVTDRPLHVDFLRVSKSSTIQVDVPIAFLNEEKSPGLKQGGVLNVLRHSLHLVCTPDSIPERIEIDLGEANIGYSCQLKDLNLPEGVKVSHLEKAETVLTLVPPKVKGSDAAASDEGESEEGASEESSSEE